MDWLLVADPGVKGPLVHVPGIWKAPPAHCADRAIHCQRMLPTMPNGSLS